MAALVAGYTIKGHRYGSTAAAAASLPRPQLAGSGSPFALGPGVVARSTGAGLVTWHQGDWTLAINFTACPAAAHPSALAKQTARAVQAAMSTVRLPGSAGVLVMAGSCGDLSSGQTTLTWLVGRNRYAVAVRGYQPQRAMAIAAAMRQAPSSSAR